MREKRVRRDPGRERERVNRRRNTQTMLTARNYVKYALPLPPGSILLSTHTHTHKAYKSQLSLKAA